MGVPINQKVQENGVEIQYFPVQFRPWVYSQGLGKELKCYIRSFDIVHIHGLYRYPQSIAAHYARKYAIPYIVRPHGSLDPLLYRNPRNRLIKRIYEYLIEFRNLNQASAVHFTTEEEGQLTRFLDLKADSVVVPNGILMNRYNSFPQKEGFRKKYGLDREKVVLHLGRINFKKGLDLLIKGFSQVARRHTDYVLVIAGPDNDGYLKNVKTWIREERIENRVIFTGMLYENEVLEALVDADVFALPSYTENFGMAVVEAMACGLPVVISDRVNIWREVKSAGAGEVIPCDADRLADALERLLDDPVLCKTMGKAGKKLAKAEYSLDRVTDKLIDA
ncbi:glycosyltransferase, partial [bacterium]|nr:glycosyltransferase [bacterium]